jgi:serine phosphatase RsbU (regulator of sigma subunit)
MRILVAWDNPSEAELLSLFLATGENEAFIGSNPAEVEARAAEGAWDVLLLAATFPTSADEGFEFFEKLQRDYPEVPVVLACRQTEMLHLPRFLTHGLRFYIVRDERGDFVFLVLSSLESSLAAIRAEESRKLAEKLREEMDGVRRLQESIIPKGLVAPQGYRVAARYEPAQMTVIGGQPVVMAGGDYYDLFCPDAHTLIIILGDAAGHGLKACMSIMTMHTLIRMFSNEQVRDTSKLVHEVNERLCENSIVQSGGGFITLFYAAIDTRKHTMTWSSAGHPLAILQNLEDGATVNVGSDDDVGLPLGISPGMEYLSNTVELPPSSRILLYTDGLTDAFPQGQENFSAFGVKGIEAVLRERRQSTPDDTLAGLFKASETFTGGAGRHDDTSAVIMDRGMS